MKKRVLSILMAAALTMSMLAGCSSGESESKSSGSSSEETSSDSSGDFSDIVIGAIVNTTVDGFRRSMRDSRRRWRSSV